VANPYAAAIDHTEFINDNANNTGSIYIWDDNGSDQERGTNSDYIIINASGNTNSSAGNISRYNGNIGSAQGFFIQLDGQGDNTVTFEEDQRIAGNNLDNNFFRDSHEITKRVRLNLTNSVGLFKQALIAWNNTVDDSQINRMYDSRIFDESAEYSVFTLKQGKSLGIQTLTTNKEIIPIGINVGEAGEYMLELDINEFNGELVLLDKLLNRQIKMTNQSYSFNSTSGKITDRFELRVSEYILESEIDQEWRVFVSDNILHISPMNSDLPETVHIYTLSGKTILRSIINSEKEINLNGLQSGVYLVNNGLKTKKIIVK
jgi:hypothetical protein